jgi:hypothetical protein
LMLSLNISRENSRCRWFVLENDDGGWRGMEAIFKIAGNHRSSWDAYSSRNNSSQTNAIAINHKEWE